MSTQPVYLDDWKLYAYLNGVRTDITVDAVTEPIRVGGLGIQGHKPTDRVGGTGWMKFTLIDTTRKYIPDSAAALSGWKLGTVIELEIIFKRTKRIYRFYVKEIDPPTKAGGEKTSVTALDWTDFAAEHPVVNPGVLTNQRADDVLRTALALEDVIQPQNTSFDVGEEVFPTTFDTVTSQTKVYDEAVKAALSELGLVYLKADRVYGETLVFENAASRVGTRTLSKISVPEADSGFLLKEDSGYILKEDGGRIILNQVQDAVFDNSMYDFEAPYGKDILNYLTIWANPRRKDTTTQNLFKLDQAFVIGSGQTFELKGTYADPAGGLPINANPSDMITPIATTDYLFNTQSDGLGTNITANLQIVSITFGSEGFTAKLQNNYSGSGWVTKFQTRGLGIYNYNPVQHLAQNQTSRTTYGTRSETFDQKYKVDVSAGKVFADGYVEEEKDPKTALKKIKIIANRSALLMHSFLGIENGYLVRIKIDKINLDGYYFIQGVEEFSISTAGFIVVTYIVKEFLSLLAGLSMIAVEFANASQDALNYGYLPHVYSDQEPDTISVSAWINLGNMTGNGVIMCFAADGGSFRIYASPPSGKILVESTLFNTSPGFWQTLANPITQDVWHHIVVVYDASSTANDPVVYVDNSLKTLLEGPSPAGSKLSKNGASLVIGNIKTPTWDYIFPFAGKIKDLRVYQHLLSVTEITDLYNGGVPDFHTVTDDLVFQTFAVKTKKLSSYIDQALTSDLNVRDNIRGVVGTPHGSPIGRTA